MLHLDKVTEELLQDDLVHVHHDVVRRPTLLVHHHRERPELVGLVEHSLVVARDVLGAETLLGRATPHPIQLPRNLEALCLSLSFPAVPPVRNPLSAYENVFFETGLKLRVRESRRQRNAIDMAEMP